MQDFLDNDPTISTAKFAAILGLTPSKGARSPQLWNAAFTAASIDAAMVPMDVTPENLAGLVAALKADKRYIGGAVAVPHKQEIAKLLDRLEPEAERIGAVNAIYRDGDELVGERAAGRQPDPGEGQRSGSETRRTCLGGGSAADGGTALRLRRAGELHVGRISGRGRGHAAWGGCRRADFCPAVGCAGL